MKSLEKNEAIAVFVSILAVVAMFAGFYFFSSDAELPIQISGEEVVSLSNLEDSSAVTNILAEATTAGGKVTKLIIEDTNVGDGKEVVLGSEVTVNYIGTLQDGTQFDNSFERGAPYTFVVGSGQVIDGWEKGILGMKEGGERILVIPSDMAYGNRSVGQIPANATLLFAVQVLNVE